MIMDSFLKIEPQVLCFPYELNKQASCTIRLFNMTRNDVAFKVMTTNPEKKYSVRPNWGVVEPGSSLDVIVTMRGPMALPPKQQCKDKFKIRSVFASPDATREDEIRKLLDKEDIGVQECKLGVIYTFPIQIPSPVAEESASSSIASRTESTNLNDSKMKLKKLLDVRPSELQFLFELRKELSCMLRLKNMTGNHVFFKVKTTNPGKYCVQPNIGMVLPRSTCDVVVRMHPQTHIPLDRQCKDKFLIQSMIGRPGATMKELTPGMFDDPGRVLEGFKLGVVYTFPSHPQSSTFQRSEEGSSLDASTLPNINSSDPQVVTQGLDRNESNVGPLFMKGIAVCLLGLLFWYILMKMLPLIWSLTFVIMLLVVKMIKNLVSNSVEDWIVKTLVYVCIHFISVIFGRRANISLT